MADRLNVSELDFDLIKTNLKTFLKQQSEFQDYDFEGSGLNILLDVLAYNTHYNAYYLNMIANESFLDTALLRNSVVSHAKSFGYVPRSIAAPRAIIKITVQSGTSTPDSLTLPKGYRFFSKSIDGISYPFITLQSYTVEKTGTNFVFDNIPIYGGQFVSYTFENSYQNNPNQLFTIPSADIDTNTLTVGIRQSSSNSTVVIYEQSEDVLDITSDSQVYFLQESTGGLYQIYFGDNVIGKKIPDGGLVIAEYLVTKGDVSNKANNFFTSATIGGYSSIVIDSKSAASGGRGRETVDEIKRAAPLNLLSQNRAVTKNDYIRLLLQKYPAFEAVNVWGGEENVPPVYGKVFISAKPKLGFEVTQTEKEYVKDNILKPISMLTVTPEIVDIDYNYMKVISEVVYDKAKWSGTKAELDDQLKTVILDYCLTNTNTFNSYFQYSGLETTIDKFNKSIISNEIDLFIGKKFRPNLIVPNNYVLDYGVELKSGSTFDNFFSTPDFTIVDQEGISRQCFFEEIPSSYTGLESVTVINPGYGYTSTPTVEIVGDGQGATARANIVNGKIASIDVLTPGIGYTAAAVYISGGGGSLGDAEAVLEGRYGRIRISYYKIDARTNKSTKFIINENDNEGVVGTVDYKLGRINLTQFAPIAVNNDFGDIIVYIKPKSNIVKSYLNKMLVIDADDPNSVVINSRPA